MTWPHPPGIRPGLALAGLLLLLSGLACAGPRRTVPPGVPLAQMFTLPAGYSLSVEVAGETPNQTKGVLINTLTGKVLAEFRKNQPGTILVPAQSREADVDLELRGYVMKPGSDASGQAPIWDLMPIKLARRTATSLKFVGDDGYENDQPAEDWNDLIVVIKVLPPG